MTCGGCWSRTGALRNATTMVWSGPQPQRITRRASGLPHRGRRSGKRKPPMMGIGACPGVASTTMHQNGMSGPSRRPVLHRLDRGGNRQANTALWRFGSLPPGVPPMVPPNYVANRDAEDTRRPATTWSDSHWTAAYRLGVASDEPRAKASPNPLRPLKTPASSARWR